MVLAVFGGEARAPLNPEDVDTWMLDGAHRSMVRGTAGAVVATGSPLPRYNEVQQKSVHNSFERNESLLAQLRDYRARSIELDIHNGRSHYPSRAGDWYVYHHDMPGFDATHCMRLSECLAQVRAFHTSFPQHEVVTLLIDLKDDFDVAGGHTPEDLDARLVAHLDSSWIAKPSDLLASCPEATTLQQAVTGDCAWPRLDTLRGKFFVALTGGNACDAGSPITEYAGAGARAALRVGFVAPSVDARCSVRTYLRSKPYVVFFNMSYEHVTSASAVEAAGFVGRVYYGGLEGGLDDPGSWAVAKAARAQLLVTDKVNFELDSWAATHSATGWPFTCFVGCDPKLEESAGALP